MANIWDEVEEIKEVQNTPQQQPTNDIWDEVEEISTQPVEQATPVLTGGIEQKVIPNWDKKGRIYYTDEQGNRIKSNVPLSRKIGNKLRATGYNIKDWLTTDVGEKAKERKKAVAMLVSAPLGIGRGIAGMALSGGLGSGVYSGSEQAIEGEFKPKQLLADIGIGAGLGGALGLGGKYVAKPIIDKIAKGKVTKAKPQVNQEVVEQPIQQIDDVIEETVPIQQVDEVVESVPQPIEQPKVNYFDEAMQKMKENPEIINTEDFFKDIDKMTEEQQLAFIDEVDKIEKLLQNKKQLNEIKPIKQSNLKGIIEKEKRESIKIARSILQQATGYKKVDKRILNSSKGIDRLDDAYANDRITVAPELVRENPDLFGYVDFDELGADEKVINRCLQILDEGGISPTEIENNLFDRYYGNIVDEVIPEQVVEDTAKMVSGETKTRSLPQSVLDAKGTPKEVKEIIKQDMPTYQVMHNQDLIKQATDEITGNFDNELIRLSSAKDFDALDYEKSRQIAKNLFSMGKYQQAVDLIDNVSENATKKGQAIQALSLWSNMTPEGAVYKAQKLVREYNKKHPKKQIQLTNENIETIASLQQEALNTTDELAKNQALARTAKYTTDLIPKEALQKLKAYRNISMLLNPKTLGRNIVGNVAFNTIDTGSKGLASLIDRGLSKFTGQRTRVAPQLGDYFKGGLQGAKTGYQEALQGIDTRGLGQRFDLSSGRTFQSKPMQALETALDVGLRVPDRAFYEATFAESVQNMMKAQGLTKPTQEILEQAEQEALESVFQNKSMLSDFALGLRGGINRIGTKEFGLGDVLIPYAQTPANLTQQAINYSPLGALKGIYNLSQGNQRQASLDLARSLIGTGLIGGGYGLAKAGLTTPSQFDENYTKNKKIRENLQPLGIRPDQLGDMWYAPFQPMSSPIATGTAMAYGENPLYAGLNTVVDQPYLQGVTRGLRDLQEGDWTKAATNVVASIPSQFVPTFASQLAQSIDPYQRETYDPNKLQYGLNSAIAKIPFASKTLPEKIDVTGQPIERYSTKGGQKLFDIFLNPTFINKKTTDPVLSELKYIYDQTKETSHFMPSVDKKLEFTDVDGNPQKIVLTGREFSEYQRRLGQRMYDEFNYVMDLPEYANADEYGKIKILENAKKLVKAEVDNEMWNKRNRNKKRSYTGGN